MSRIPLAALLIVLAAVCVVALADNSTTTTATTTVRAHLKHVAKLNSLINALQDATGSSRPAAVAVARNRTATRPIKRPGGIKALEAQDGAVRQAAELNYTIIGLNETSTEWQPPSLVNQTELSNATNSSETAPPPSGEESSDGFFGFVRKVFKAVTSIDRYTLILTCAFVFGVVLIAVLIFIAICVCKRFGNRTPVKQQKYDEIGLKSPATGKRGKPKSKLDFLDESKPFMETNVDAAAPSPTKSGVEEAAAPVEPVASAEDAEVRPPSSDSPVRPQEAVVVSPQPPPTPKKESSLSKISLNIAASLSSLNQKTAGIFTKNPTATATAAAAASSKDSSVISSKRQSIISAKLPTGAARSHRISLGASQSSLVQQPVNFAIVSDDIDFLFKQSAPSQPDLARAAALDSPVRPVAAPDSLANSVSDIYRQAIVEKRERGQNKLKKTKSNGMMSPGADAAVAAAEISFNPGAADTVSFLSESEKSCY